MRKIFLLLVLFSIDAIVFSQGISVRFIGRINVTNYCRLDSVSVTNITRNWTETIVYPDTIIVLGGTGNVNLNIAEEQGLGQNIPNPFDCDTRVNLSVSQREDVRMQLLDISGKLYANYSGTLDAGVHAFDISAATTQTYILNATIGNRSYSIRMVNTGSGCGSSIKYAGISDGIISKQTWDNEFQIGDNMRYIGYTYIDGNILESEPVLQSLRESQDIVLAFRLGSIGSLNGHDWVDLGLPSGTCWATCNVGSDTPEGYGNYYAWGETTTKTIYDWNTYRYCNGSYNTLTKYCDNTEYGNNGFTDTLTILEASDDAAIANWGSGWRMPTYDELNELMTNCIVTCATQNGVNGRLFTGPNGNSIFLPTAGFRYDSELRYAGSYGYYWSSSLVLDDVLGDPLNPSGLNIESEYCNVNGGYRYVGRSIRAVCNGDNIGGDTNIYAPTVTTGAASSITTTGATLSGNVISDGGATVTSWGFLYGTNSSNLTQTMHGGSGTGDFTANVIGLIPNTTYYYKAFAINSAGTSYGEVRSFTTLTLPTVITSAVSISDNSVTLSGNITSNGGATITARGFLYATNPNNLSLSIQSGSATSNFTAVLSGLNTETYYYKAYATNSVGTAYGEVRTFTTRDLSESTGYTNGHGYVDLGLPSGTRWATCNVGATAPEGYGDYFAWGETAVKDTYTWETYTYAEGTTESDPKLTKYNNDAQYGDNGFTDNLTILEASDDVATANWGEGWRMPTKDEMVELKNNCIVTWTTLNGVKGSLFTGPNGNSIFLPVAGSRRGSDLCYAGSLGHYWSSSLYTGYFSYPNYAWYLGFYYSDSFNMNYDNRIYGYSVRAVCNQ